MDSKKENRMNKLQTSIEKSFLLQPAIKITQYNNLNNISLDRSFNSKVGIGKEQEEFQFQKNRRFGNVARSILNRSIDVSPDSKGDSHKHIDRINESPTNKNTLLGVNSSNFCYYNQKSYVNQSMSVENEDYLTTRCLEDLTKQTRSDMRKSIGASSELDDRSFENISGDSRINYFYFLIKIFPKIYTGIRGKSY